MIARMYVDPAGEPWRTKEVPTQFTRGIDEILENYETGERYELILRFARKGMSNRFYLVGIVKSSWDNADLEAMARAT